MIPSKLIRKCIPHNKAGWLHMLIITTGVVGGLVYQRFVDCQNGGCAIASSPVYNALIGGLIGSVTADLALNKTDSKKSITHNKAV